MQDLSTTAPPTTTRRSMRRTTARWLVTFVGFPLGGLLAELLVGRVDGPGAALAGGLITGSVLGAVQAWGLRSDGPAARQWVAATAVGFMVGLGVGAAAVDYQTSASALVAQGAITGLAVGAAQAVVLRSRVGRPALVWPPALAVVWAAGWAVTNAAGVNVDEQFTVFGSSGAILVTLVTAVLPVVIERRGASAS
jgi:hypothetical protein